MTNDPTKYRRAILPQDFPTVMDFEGQSSHSGAPSNETEGRVTLASRHSWDEESRPSTIETAWELGQKPSVGSIGFEPVGSLVWKES